MYKLVFFGDASALNKFRELLKRLPPVYYIKLRRLYVYNHSSDFRVSLSSILDNSKRSALWKKKTRNVHE